MAEQKRTWEDELGKRLRGLIDDIGRMLYPQPPKPARVPVPVPVRPQPHRPRRDDQYPYR